MCSLAPQLLEKVGELAFCAPILYPWCEEKV